MTTDNIGGYFLIGCNPEGQVVLTLDEDLGFIMSATQARMLATKLLECANEGDKLKELNKNGQT